jgi:hypothetical protein
VSGDLTAEEIVRLNSHELTAHLLVTERQRRRDDAARAAQIHRDVMATLDRAQEIGLRGPLAGARQVDANTYTTWVGRCAQLTVWEQTTDPRREAHTDTYWVWDGSA